MNRQQVVDGTPFTWDGHFKRISRDVYTSEQPLQVWRYNASKQAIINKKGNEVWNVSDVTDSKIIVSEPAFGKVTLLISELKEVREVSE